jgi:hypothetical protein
MFQILWGGQKESFVMPWIKWNSLALPKLMGGWGLKNIHCFSTALAAKTGWRLISSNNLWSKVIQQKYINPASLEDWIRNPEKSHQTGSIMWKALVKYFEVISQGLAWKVGRGNSLRLGRDPWVGATGQHLLPQNLIDRLHERGIFHLIQIADEQHSSIWSQGWQDAQALNLEEPSLHLGMSLSGHLS